MIPPRLHFIHQIAVTSLCWPHTGIGTEKRGELTGCSNCTRMLAHEKKRYIMSPDQFEQCVTVAKGWTERSPHAPHRQGRPLKCVALFGGDPLLSPFFGEYVEIICNILPNLRNRGLWVSLDWRTYENPKYGKAKPLVEKLMGGMPHSWDTGPCMNWNMHEEHTHCEHHPNLHAIIDFVPDEKRRMELINECWLNAQWSAAYALNAQNEPKFYFCEVASSFDRVMDLGIGLDVVDGVWGHDLLMVRGSDGILRPEGPYAKQVMTACNRCGQALPHTHGRRDREWKDDISETNLKTLIQIESPMVKRGHYVLGDAKTYNESVERQGYKPWHYIRGHTDELCPPLEPSKSGK